MAQVTITAHVNVNSGLIRTEYILIMSVHHRFDWAPSSSSMWIDREYHPSRVAELLGR